MHFVVTGAAGFIGSHLCDMLVANDHDVVGIDDFSDYYARETKEANIRALRASSRFQLAEIDLSVDDPKEYLTGADGVFHLAAQPGVRGSWGTSFEPYVRNNVLATQRLLEAMKQSRTPLVYASSSSVYGLARRLPMSEDDATRPVSPYGVTKLAGEHLAMLYAHEYSLPVAAMRLFTVYGPRQRPDMAFTRFINAASKGGTLEVLGDGMQSRDFTFVLDAVRAINSALGANGIFNVGGGSRTTIREVIEIIGRLAGSTVSVTYRPRVAGDVDHTWADTSRAQDQLEWKPRVGLEEGLAAQINASR